ncbi:sigma-54 dependent transcriptional regulator [uncultured Rubinisphaera sp.]|uniref:sigma-54-dependent transcriptional regulator n=1 Tax=uncultured Rubinisphaera sp. TaxID=1678686 RepID=UPI000EC64191|nr:sigma-54-dependent Fis family transcriptional regulator [Planctomycetaceae bacterium]|tara:strand:+ start:1936 stop:3324 length:1389 start_codon:yes stop_codon:yes gene_type:complete
MSEHQKKILIADDEPLYLRTTGQLLRNAGYECVCVSDANSALEKLRSESFDLILSDLNMPGNLKLELLQQGRSRWPHIPLIVITGVPSLPTAIESVRLGITDYLLKPVKYEDLITSVSRVLAQPGMTYSDQPQKQPDIEDLSAKFPEIIGRSEPMLEVLEIVDRVAHTDTSVLITGESGTGKEVVAQAIHRHSGRSDHNFQIIDCTAIPESLFESVLFGHAKGSFTGAIKDQDGLLSRSHFGTAFFDELGELPIASQAKLLRAVQEQAFTPVGKNELVRVDTRYLCATNRDLQEEVNAGRFRQDLYYRLGVIHMELPPLRERGDDVVLLANLFLKKLQRSDAKITGFSDEVLDCFRKYEWPGNIRELRNVIERAVALSRTETVQLVDLPKPIRQSSGSTTVSILTEISREEALDNADHAYLVSLLEKHGGNISKAARQAGLSRQGMHKLLSRHELDASEFRE